MNQELASSLVDDPDFPPLFIQDGYAALFQARVVCEPLKPPKIEIAVQFLELDEPQDPGVARDWHFTSGISCHSETPEGLIVEAATVVGPIRGCLLHPSNLDKLLEGVRDLLKRVWEELDDAHDQPGAIFQRDRLTSADSLLEELCEHWQHSQNDPEVSRFLELPAPSDSPMLH